MFTEAMDWSHGVEFLCVAFQNRVAYAMGGTTLHSAGDLSVGAEYKSLSHTDVDVLFTRNQDLRWVLVDECFMLPDELFGAFEQQLADAAQNSPFKRSADGQVRMFGGYNVMTFGDMFQIPPIPAFAALFLVPRADKSERAKKALEFFWGESEDGLNFFVELTEQMRVRDDPWYQEDVLQQCRYGRLTEESYNYLHGFPTQHAGSWCSDGHLACGMPACQALGSPDIAWETVLASECSTCQAERKRRNRLLDGQSDVVSQEPFSSAPYIHKKNEPKYHAMLLRASEHGKRERQHMLWFAAVDKPLNPSEIVQNPSRLQAKLERFLYFHDQQTGGIPGLNVLYNGLKVRVTRKLAKTKTVTILKHSSGTVVGWDLYDLDREFVRGAERFLNYLPKCIYIKFDGATWVIHKDLGPGVFPLYPTECTWTLKKRNLFESATKRLLHSARFCKHRLYDPGHNVAGSARRVWEVDCKPWFLRDDDFLRDLITLKGCRWSNTVAGIF